MKNKCRCHQPKCDCARWDAIYRERFEDADYYGLHPSTPQSALGGNVFDICDAEDIPRPAPAPALKHDHMRGESLKGKDNLTPRQLLILRWFIAPSLPSMQEIADRLHVTHGTLRVYMAQIYAKLGIGGNNHRLLTLWLIAHPGQFSLSNECIATGDLHLTRAERSILRWFVDPRLLTMQAIAKRLRMSYIALKLFVSKCYAKLGLRGDHRQLVLWVVARAESLGIALPSADQFRFMGQGTTCKEPGDSGSLQVAN